MFSTFSGNGCPAPPSYGELPPEDAREADQATASRLRNGSSATPRSQHLAPNPTSSAAMLPSQPVLVRTPSSPQVLASPTPRAPRLPPVSSFAFAAVLRAVDPDIRDPVQAIAEICAKSRMSLADEHGAHIPPQGEIRRRLGRPEHALVAVPEAEGSREGLAERREKSGALLGSWINELDTPPGIQREYWLEVNDQELCPDGYLKPFGKVFNGSYPGPLIEACWGDDIVVHVTNKLKTNGTTIHWHGMRQNGTNAMDGVNGVTQCPVATGDTFTYRFKAQQYGHTWYHSHYSLQYPDGVAGPLLIHGPSSANWDEAWEPILINDWVHDSAFAVFQQELDITSRPGPPVGDSILVNGTGHYNCSDSSDARCVTARSGCGGGTSAGSYFHKTFEKGKRYLLRLINASADAMFIVSIDNHNLTVISNDLVPIEPYTTNAILVGIGQRYSVIVEANPDTPSKDGNYWMRTELAFGCGQIIQNTSTTGIITYKPNNLAIPASTKHRYSTDCTDEPYESLVPVVPWNVGQAENNVTENTYQAGITRERFHDWPRWELANYPLWLNFSNPTILSIANKTFDPQYDVIEYNQIKGWVYLVVTGNLSRLIGNQTLQIPAAHPIHLHGHDFAILAQSNKTYGEATDPFSFNFKNPPRRDVALLPSNGYLAIAFKPDNPGIWLLHCHIAWHASSGLALQILERQQDILRTIGPLEKTVDTCRGWDRWYAENVATFDQNDSGI